MHEDGTLHSIDGLRRLEANAARRLGDDRALMRRAGLAAWHAVLAHWPDARRIVVACGPGNNGGDGHELAMHALACGRDVSVVGLPATSPAGGTAAEAVRRYTEAGGRSQVFDGRLPHADLVVDALFGIGLHRAPEGDAARLIEAINSHGAPVLALDVPSGVDAGTGTVPGIAVQASHTLEFMRRKAGLWTGAALNHRGTASLDTLELETTDFDGVEAVAMRWTVDALAHALPARRRDSHKGQHGRVLCIGGDHGHGGAIVMVAEAALRVGAGLVEVATRPAHVAPLLARRPEAMARGCDVLGGVTLEGSLAACDVVAIGPGLSQSEWAREAVPWVSRAGKPLVLDADALNLLAESAWPVVPSDTILTPHPGEAARLLGVTTPDIQRDRLASARQLAERHGCTVVLKGAGTVVASPGRRPVVIAAGNPGMAVGGMGDVLTGTIAALRAQGLDAFEAACTGALLHAAAGDRAVLEGGARGLLPTDLSPWLRRLANPDFPDPR
ncbi:NAD(P)H-hydrate dehydratase [Lysobacter sp. SG-8]|uniref:Bifunctional NAD(P)H-hydrate repair enzyme n=1 Tax=Marilutibacter penaei TaxID=2759900 RepID=A0A7W3YDV0_9GAMM|nr:NAD(P)H-hydrate dehydratase [Lysobacter penaei]MBB1087437.1 NAD(P)H-hydrate dehydratase [Lysobacter penaei]